MEIDPSDQSVQDNYKIMTGLVVPRPIAWVTTLNEAGKINLAPFSAFTFVSHDPPMIAISIGKTGNLLKDTGRNILRDGQFVVNIANHSQMQKLHDSSAEYPTEESEVDALSIETLNCVTVRPPRLRCVPASMECGLHLALPLGNERHYLMIGRVQLFHLADLLFREGKIDTSELNPLARLGGPNYATLGDITTLAPATIKSAL